MMTAIRTIGIFCLALAAGGAALCAAPQRASAQANARAAAAPAKAPAKLPTKADEAAPKQGESEARAAKKQEALDVAALKERLRDTKAIGFFTKLELQHQVNDLLQRFREHYHTGGDSNVAELRQPFDLLVLKLLALLQDSDPALARTIAESREAIWNILADPEKFKSVSWLREPKGFSVSRTIWARTRGRIPSNC